MSAPAPNAPRRGVAGVLVRALVVAWLALLAALGAAALSLLYGWQLERLRGALEVVASEALDHEVRIDRLEGALLERLTLHGVSVREVAAADEERERLEALRVSLRFDPRASLRRGALVLGEVSIVGPQIRLSRSEDEPWAVAGWGLLGRAGEAAGAEPAAPPPPLAILIGTLDVNDAHLTLDRDARSGLEDVSGRLDVHVEGLRLRPGAPLQWPNSTEARFHLRSAGWRGIELGAGHLDWRLAGSRAVLESLALQGPVGSIGMTGEVVLAGPADRARALGGELRAHVDRFDLGALVHPEDDAAERWTRISGDLDVTLRGDPEGDEPGVDVDLHLLLGPSFAFGAAVEAADLSGTYRTGEQRWSVAESTVDLAAGRVSVAGRGAALRMHHVEARAEDVALGALPRSWLPPARLEGDASIELHASGSFSDPEGRVDARVSGLRIDGAGPGQLALAFSALGARRYRLDELVLSYGPDAGHLANTAVESRAAAELAVLDDGLDVRGLALEWTGGAVAIDGRYEDGRLGPTNVRVDSLDVGVAARLLDLPGEPGGVVTGSLELTGGLDDPDLAADLDWRAPRYAGLRADHIDVAIGGDPDHRSVQAVVLDGGRAQLRLASELPRPFAGASLRRWLADERLALSLEADGLDLVWLEPLLAERDLVPGGRLAGSLRARGGPAGPTAQGELRLIAGRVERADAPQEALPLVGPITGALAFVDRSVSTSALRYGVGADELLLDGRLGWGGDRGRDVDLDVTVNGVGFSGRAVLGAALRGDEIEPSVLTFSDFDVAELARRVGIVGTVGGRMTGELVVRGPTAEPHFRTRLEWTEPSAAGKRAERVVVEARTDAGIVAIDAGLDRDRRRVLDAEGEIALDRTRPVRTWLAELARWPTSEGTRIAVEANAFPLDWLPILAPRLPLKTGGVVDGAVTLRGADPVIQVDGALTLDAGVFTLATQSARVGPLAGELRFAGQEAFFDRLDLQASRGSATLSGYAHWDETGIDDVRLRTDFDGYRFDQLGLLQTTLRGRLEASGAPSAMHVAGNLSLDGIRIAFPSQEDPVLKEIRVLGLPDGKGTSIREGEAGIAGLEQRSSVDVVFSLPKGTWVRGMGLDAEIVGEVHVTKAAGEGPRYLGRMEVEHGRYSLQGRRFQLDRGVAVFTGPTPVPDVDIQAQRRASRDVTVYAHVTGPADAPRLELTSDPQMDTAEIISYLFFGRSATAGDNPQRTDIGASAASVAGSMLMDSVAPELRDTLRIDEISVTSGESDATPQVEVESQLTPDVYLRLIQSLGASADEAIEVRWRFWKGLSVKSKVSRSGASAIDLLWEVDFWGVENYGLDGLTPPPPPYRARAPGAACRPPALCPDPTPAPAPDPSSERSEPASDPRS